MRRLLVLGCLGLALAACGGSGSGAAPVGRATTTTRTSGLVEVLEREPVPDGFRVLDGGEQGYTVAVPGAWRDMPFDDAAVSALIEANREPNPGLALLLETRRRTAGSNLLVLDDRPPGANLNVFRVPNERPLSPSEVAAASLELLDPAQTEALDQQLMSMSARDVDRARVRLPAGLAVRARYTLTVRGLGGRTSDVAGVLYYLPTAGAVYVVSLSTTDLGSYQADFDRVAKSFTVK